MSLLGEGKMCAFFCDVNVQEQGTDFFFSRMGKDSNKQQTIWGRGVLFPLLLYLDVVVAAASGLGV